MLIIITILTILLILFIGLFIQSRINLSKITQEYLHSIKGDEISNQYKRSELGSSNLYDINTSETTANIDRLTGLPARELFEDRMLQAVHQGKRMKTIFAAFILNINDFHKINETYGYDTGDKLLKSVADRLQCALRQVDTMTRFAGDIFAGLLIHVAQPESVIFIAQRLLDNMAQPFNIDNKALSITANIGIAIYPKDGEDCNTIINKANEAYLKSKSLGKGKFSFYQQELVGLAQREINLHDLLISQNVLKHISVYYHSYTNTMTNEIICMEIVPCLRHPEEGVVPFADFAAIAERSKRLNEVSLWTLRHTIKQFKKWNKIGINSQCLLMSATLRQAKDNKFIDEVLNIIQEFELEPGKIILEITESANLSTESSLENAFDVLKNSGIKIAITVLSLGHFALQKINKLPISFLIIEAPMLSDTEENKTKELIIHSMIDLATEMNITILAKSVENNEQKNHLKQIGCHVMDGKLFGGPQEIIDIQ